MSHANGKLRSDGGVDFEKQELVEISLASIPMNPSALVTPAKSGSGPAKPKSAPKTASTSKARAPVASAAKTSAAKPAAAAKASAKKSAGKARG